MHALQHLSYKLVHCYNYKLDLVPRYKLIADIEDFGQLIPVHLLFRTMKSQDHDVVLVRRKTKPGILGIRIGEGMGRGWKGGGQFTSNLGPSWTGSYHDKEGFQVSKRGMGLKQQGIGKVSKNKGIAPQLCC